MNNYKGYTGAGMASDVGDIKTLYGGKQSNPISTFGGAMGTAAAFLTSANPVAGILLTLAGGVLGALTQRKPRRSAEEVYFDNMTKFYYNVGKRSRMAASIASAITGKDVTPVYNSGADAIGKIAYNGGVE